MKRHRLALVLLSLALLAGCASFRGKREAGAKDDSGVVVYQPAQLLPAQYETIQRLWGESWRSVLWVPTYSSEADGIAALQRKAAGLGANGLVNVACHKDKGQVPVPWPSEVYICYGNAIRVRTPAS